MVWLWLRYPILRTLSIHERVCTALWVVGYPEHLSGREGEKGESDGLHDSRCWTRMTCGMCDECGDIMGGGLMGFDRKL